MNEVMEALSNPIVAVLLFFIVLGLGLEILGFFATILFRFSKVPPLKTSSTYPGVTILKPCYDNKDNEAINFDQYFKQDYPGKYEIIFVVNAETDPIVPVIKKFLTQYPNVEAKYILSKTQDACAPKINALYDGHVASKHEIVIWSDSDTIIKENYLSQMVASLQEPGVSLVTTPQYDTRANTFGSAFKVMANNADVAVFVMGYWILNRTKKIAWGHSMGFWKKDLDEIKEGWPFLNQFLADDLGLPLLFAKHKKKTVFANIYCPVECANKKAKEMIIQKKRWVMCQRFVIKNKLIYLMGMFFYPQIPATFLVLITGFNSWTLSLFVWIALSRIFLSAVFELLYLNSLRMSIRYFWTILLWDLAQVYFFWHGFRTDIVKFQGKSYHISKDYSLTRLD